MTVRRFIVVVPLVTALGLGCGGPADPVGVIERETFVATWVDLRKAAMSAGGFLPEPERARVLGRHGVTEDQLIAFADAYGADPRFMADVWTEVETRMRPPPADSSAAASDSATAPQP